MLSLVLFIICYSFLLWLFDEHKSSKYYSTSTEIYNTNTVKDNQNKTIYPEDVFDLLDDAPPIEYFIKDLKLRTARKVARELKIAQKVNGKDKSLAQFKREIRQKLIKSPTLLEQAYNVVAA